MKTSETLSKIAPALLKAQKAITFAAKDTDNSFFKSKYADLPAVIDAIKPALNDNGIMFIQTNSPSDAGFLCLTTRLMHESGEWIEDTASIPLPKNDPQGYGSAATYGRRYALAAITGLYQDDDDGNAASNVKAAPKAAKSVAADTLGNMNEESRLYLKELAMEVLSHLPDEVAMYEAYGVAKAGLDADEQVAWWAYFDSKSRSALKRAKEELDKQAA